MQNLTIMSEAAALGGYTITSSTGQDTINKARAQRRVNLIKADVISRYGGKWPSCYREGWLPLIPLYNTGSITLTNGSRTVTGSGTVWTTSMKGAKLLSPEQSYYKIASVQSATQLTLTQPFQGTSQTPNSYQIWQDEYRLYPEVLSIGGFVDYNLPKVMKETWQRDMKESFPMPTSVEEPTVFTVIGREAYTAIYSTGTITAAINTNVITGSGTSWMSNIEPGFEFIVGSNTYHVKRVNSDTEIELYQQLTIAASGTSYISKGKNSLLIRFKKPTDQRIVNYWYWAKDYPLVNDNDEDWITELFPKVLINGMIYYDYMDKNDPIRVDRSSMAYEDSIKNMKVSQDNAYTGVRTLGYFIPDDARL